MNVEDWYEAATTARHGGQGYAIERNPRAVKFIRKILERLIKEKKRITVPSFIAILKAKYKMSISDSSMRDYLKNRTGGLYDKTLRN